ncbi:MAG: hypothetical protein ABL951_13085, partial [Alphaproteobacteria bacterium]
FFPLPHQGGGGRNEDGGLEIDPVKMQRDALVAAAVAGLMKAGDPASFSKQTGRLKIPAIEARLAGDGHDIKVSGAERDALQAKHPAPGAGERP